jgi:hypothetical protein
MGDQDYPGTVALSQPIPRCGMNTHDNPIKLDIADVWMDADGLIRIVFNQTSEHGIVDAHQIIDAHNQLAGETPCGVLADIRGIKVGADRAARGYYVTDEAARLKTAMAMVADSPLQRMVGNLFFPMSQPPYPTRMFKSETVALDWLMGQRVQSAAHPTP